MTLKIKVIIIMVLLILVTSIGGYWYLTKMSVVSGNLNVNKTKPIDKLCNYNVYSDFYYRINNYKSNTTFAELTPMRTTICYDLKANNVELQNKIYTQNNIILDDTNGRDIEKQITLLENFRKTYSEIITTQDKEYFKKSYETAKKTLNSLYGINSIDITEVNPRTKYYTTIENLPIKNMVVEYFNLKHISLAPIEVRKKDSWQPNILEWHFGEKDRIYLQYLKKSSNSDFDKYIQYIYKEKQEDKTIVRLTKFNRNKLSKMFLIFDDKQNKIKTLFMDNNGYIYALIMQVSNKKAFETYFNDYMRIAYGIYFVEKNGLDTSFIIEQDKVTQYLKKYNDLSEKLVTKYDTLKEYKCNAILQNYKETKEIHQKIENYKKLKENSISLSFDQKFELFKKLNNTYPNEALCHALEDDIKNIELLTEAVDELKPLTIHYEERFKEGAVILKKQCSNKIECVEKLKKNDWEVTE